MRGGIAVPRRTGDGRDNTLRRHIAESATVEHEETFGGVLREFAGDLGGDEHRARLAALGAGDRVDIRFGWLPAGHPGRGLGTPGEWGWLEPDDRVTTYT